MVDLPLMRAILRALPEEAALCPGRRRRSAAIGRTEASTGGDRRLGAVSVVRLTEIFRRAPESRIVTNAHRSPRVRCPILARSTAATSIFDAVDAQEGYAGSWRLCGSGYRSTSGSTRAAMSRCSALNRGGPRHARSIPSCRMRLNPPGQIRIERFGWTSVPADKVM
jgi:exodeoxyribonuclease V alpha subunit